MNDTVQQAEWMDYRDAAKLMLCRADYFNRRCADGSFKYFRELRRYQRKRGTRLYLLRADVEAWVAANLTPAEPPPTRPQFNGNTYESIAPELRRLGARKTLRALGLE